MNDDYQKYMIGELTDRNKKDFVSLFERIENEDIFSKKGVVKIIAHNKAESELFEKQLVFLKNAKLLRDFHFTTTKSEETIFHIKAYEQKLYNFKESLLSKDKQPKQDFTKQTAKITMAGKVARLTINGQTYTLHKFRSINEHNYLVLKTLLAQPNTALTKAELGIPKALSKVKDLPKTMGFTNKLKDIFFNIDNKNQTLALFPEKVLTDMEAEIIKHYVNTQNR
jgi:hypothetical protein